MYMNIRTILLFSLCIDFSNTHPQFHLWSISLKFFWVVWDLFCFPFLLFYWGTWYPKKTKDSRRGCLHELRDMIESIENKLPSEILCAWVLVSASKVLEQSWFEIEFAHDRERWTSNEDTIDVAADYNFNRKKRRYKRVKRAHTRAIPFLWLL